MQALLLLMLFFMFPSPAAAGDAALAGLFARKGVMGTLVLSSLKSGRTIVHNDERASRRFSAASTFKILNTLIALEEKVATGKDHLIRWDGRRHDLADWNRDQTLESAFRVSCVWYYQELALRIGADKYRDYLNRSGYGKLREPFDTTTFWLDGSLEISAMDQADFLRKLCLRKLPFSDSSYATLREIMVAEKTPEFTLYGKTGWAASANPQIGWYVGYLEMPDEVWFFALNMDLRSESDLALRKQLVREALQAKGIIR
jgi:beta-lactamase class D